MVTVVMMVMMMVVAALIIYCCITNYPQNLMVQNNTLFKNLIVSVGQGSGQGSAGCLWLKVSHKTAMKVSAGAAIAPVVSMGGGSASKLTHMVAGRTQFLLGSWSSLGVGLRPFSVPCHVGFSIE